MTNTIDYVSPVVQQGWSKLAIASFVMSIAGLFWILLVFFFVAILPIYDDVPTILTVIVYAVALCPECLSLLLGVCGVVAIRRSKGRLRGMPFAISTIAISCGTGVLLIIINLLSD